MNGTTFEEMREALEKSQKMYGEQRERTKEARDRAARHEATIAELRAELAELKSASVPVLETPPPQITKEWLDRRIVFVCGEGLSEDINTRGRFREGMLALRDAILGAPVEPVPAPRLESQFKPGDEVVLYGREMLIDAVMFFRDKTRPSYELIDESDENQRYYEVDEYRLSSPPVGPQE